MAQQKKMSRIVYDRIFKCDIMRPKVYRLYRVIVINV